MQNYWFSQSRLYHKNVKIYIQSSELEDNRLYYERPHINGHTIKQFQFDDRV